MANNDDFHARALASFNRQMALAANDADAGSTTAAAAVDVESYAKSLVEDDLPKVDSAVKGYLSLVAARSAVASDVDVLPSSALVASSKVRCTFAASAGTPVDANRCALVCARTLLATINSTTIPNEPAPAASGGTLDTIAEDAEEEKISEEEKMKTKLESDATKVLWNKLVQSAKDGGDKAKQTKPSKVLGRTSLSVAYPYIRERFRRGMPSDENEDGNNAAIDATKNASETRSNTLQSLSDEALPPVNSPKGIEPDQWEAFYTEFGNLLSRSASSLDANESPQSDSITLRHDDSALIWSNDKGVAELRSRREGRAQRASEALASAEGAKAEVAEALGSAAS